VPPRNAHILARKIPSAQLELVTAPATCYSSTSPTAARPSSPTSSTRSPSRSSPGPPRRRVGDRRSAGRPGRPA
jgi:hypothetical protein